MSEPEIGTSFPAILQKENGTICTILHTYPEGRRGLFCSAGDRLDLKPNSWTYNFVRVLGIILRVHRLWPLNTRFQCTIWNINLWITNHAVSVVIYSTQDQKHSGTRWDTVLYVDVFVHCKTLYLIVYQWPLSVYLFWTGHACTQWVSFLILCLWIYFRCGYITWILQQLHSKTVLKYIGAFPISIFYLGDMLERVLAEPQEPGLRGDRPLTVLNIILMLAHHNTV